jgi:hypothetical protein
MNIRKSTSDYVDENGIIQFALIYSGSPAEPLWNISIGLQGYQPGEGRPAFATVIQPSWQDGWPEGGTLIITRSGTLLTLQFQDEVISVDILDTGWNMAEWSVLGLVASTLEGQGVNITSVEIIGVTDPKADSPVIDLFTDADDTLLTDHESDSGHNWGLFKVNDTITTAYAKIQGNQLRLSSGTGSSATAWAISSGGGADFKAWVDIDFSNFVDPATVGMVARWVNTQNWVTIAVMRAYTGGFIQIKDSVAGVGAFRATTNFPSEYTPTKGRLMVTVSGSAITTTWTPVEEGVGPFTASSSDATTAGAGTQGLWVSGNGYGIFENFTTEYSGAIQTETQSVYTNGTGGTFTLTKPGGLTATDISPVSTKSALQAKLESLYGSGKVIVDSGTGVSSDPWIIRLLGDSVGENLDQMTGDGSGLTGVASAPSITTAQTAISPTAEKWSVAIVGATGGTFRLSVKDVWTDPIDYGASSSEVQAALVALSTVGSGGMTVSGSGTAGDPYVILVSDASLIGVNLRQLEADNTQLIGTGYPSFTHATVTESAGPWHWHQRLNWINSDTGEYGLPENGDSLYFEIGDQSRCPKYDLDQSALTVAGIYILGGFSDNAVIGLPRWNQSGYWEYRPTDLQINLSGDGPIFVGSRGQGGSPLLNINVLETKATITVYGTAAPVNGEVSSLQFQGTNEANTLTLFGGFFAAAPYAGQSATLASLTQMDGSFLSGEGATIGPINKTGGSILLDRTAVSGIFNIQG